MDIQQLKDDLYHDFLAIRGMRASLGQGEKSLPALFSHSADNASWLVSHLKH
jgi:hypothetical protein